MKSFLKSCTVVALAALPLVSCGSHSSSKKAPETVTREPNRVQSATAGLTLASATDDQSLLGNWISSCQPAEDNSLKVSMSFQKNYALQAVTVFLDSRCASPALELRTVQNYNAQSGTLLFTAQRHSAILHMPELATSASQSNSCGFNKWLPGVEYDITNLNCPDTDEGLSFSNNTYGSRTRADYTVNGSSLDLDGIDMTRTTSLGNIPSFIEVDQVSAALPGRVTARFIKQ